MQEPTNEQCNKNAIFTHDGKLAMATYYPQMGGYTSKCVVVTKPGLDACFDVYVWHDGDFPFSGDEGEPVLLHHCSADQFIRFGQTIQKFQNRGIV